MSVRRPSVASEHSAVLSDHNSVLSPAKSAKTASVAEQSVEPTRQYASSITSSQMTHETMDYTNDDRSTHTAQVQQMKANMKPEKIPVHPKLVPTNADLKRSNMLDRYAGIRDPTFKATWDLSEIAKGSDKGKAGSIFSFSTAKTKKTYDVAVKNPIIAAKEAEDASKGGAGHGGGFGGLFRRSSRASHQDGPAAKPVLIDDKRDPKEIFAEAERMAAWEAQEKERKEAERAEERERQRIANEMAKQERKRKDAEAKEQRRQEREERKRQSKLTVNTANAGPPPRYSQAGAQQAGVASQISPEAASSGDESSPDIEKQHSEGHRLGDEVPGGAGDRPHDSNFNEEFSVLDHSTVGREHGAEDDVASGGSSITEEAPRTVQDENTQAVAAAEDEPEELHEQGGKTYRDIGTQTLVDAATQTDPIETPAAASGTATPTPRSVQHQPKFAGPPVALTDKVAFREPERASTLPTTRASPATGATGSTAATAASPRSKDSSGGGGGIKGLFRRLSRTKSYKGNKGNGGTKEAAATTAGAATAAATTKADEKTVQPEKATVSTMAKPEEPEDAQSMLTLDSMWVKPPKKSRLSSTAAKTQSIAAVMHSPAMALYHENGIHDTVYPAVADQEASGAATPSRNYAEEKKGPSSAFALYHAGGHHGTVYPRTTTDTITSAEGTAPAADEIQKEQHYPNSFEPKPIPVPAHLNLANGLGPVAKDNDEESVTQTSDPSATVQPVQENAPADSALESRELNTTADDAAVPITLKAGEPASLADDAEVAHAADEAEESHATTTALDDAPAPIALRTVEPTSEAKNAEVAHAADEAEGSHVAAAATTLDDAPAPIAQQTGEPTSVADDAEVSHAADEAEGSHAATTTLDDAPALIAQQTGEPASVADDAEVAHAADEAQGVSSGVADRPDDVDNSKIAESSSEHPGDVSAGSAMHLYHEAGTYDSVYRPERK